MIERIQKATASSPEGARGLIKGVLTCALQNVSFMLPVGLLYFLVKNLMEGTTAGRTAFYVTGCVVCFAFILLATWFQYNGTFFTTYKESGVRRLALAERLRKLPLYDPMQGALNNLAAVIAMRTNVARMNEILEYPIQTGSDELTNQGCDIVFDHVGFAYNSGETVLRDVSFTAKQGEVTALVGPSGGGKTTVSRLAARFWNHEKGSITVGGMDISKVDPEKLMGLYSIVFQDVTLFDNSILENIRLGRKDATDEEVLEAARLANCDEFAEKLPDGWNTYIGENGCALTGGERQRITIARAFLKDAPIILLDEATASLDVENETLIQTALSWLIQNKTVLIIAHRMRTVAGADKIVVLSDGVVAEQGAPDALYAQNGIYTHMVQFQTGSQNWAI